MIETALIWILIVVPSGSVNDPISSVTFQEFNSEETCRAAEAAFNGDKTHRRKLWGGDHAHWAGDFRALCLRK